MGDRQIVSQNQVASKGPGAFADHDIPRSTGVNRDGCQITPIPNGHVSGSVIVDDIETNFEAVVQISLNLSERTVLCSKIEPSVRFAPLVFLKRRSVVALKVGTDPSQPDPVLQLPVVLLPFHVVPAVA